MKLVINHHHYTHYPELENLLMAIEDLRREVAESKDATASAITLIEGIRDQLDELAANATELEALKAEIAELSTELSDSTDGLAAAVANSPGDEPDPEEPAV